MATQLANRTQRHRVALLSGAMGRQRHACTCCSDCCKPFACAAAARRARRSRQEVGANRCALAFASYSDVLLSAVPRFDFLTLCRPHTQLISTGQLPKRIWFHSHDVRRSDEDPCHDCTGRAASEAISKSIAELPAADFLRSCASPPVSPAFSSQVPLPVHFVICGSVYSSSCC